MPPTQFFNLVADAMYFNALSNVNLEASSFNNGGTGNANVYIRGFNAYLNEFGIHHENPGNGGGDNVRCDWSANCSIFGGIGDDRGVSGVGQAHRCAQSSGNPFFPTTGVMASEVGQLVTFSQTTNFGPAFQNHSGNGSAIIAEDCSVPQYNGIISQIQSGGAGATSITAFNPNTGLGNASSCILTSLDCLLLLCRFQSPNSSGAENYSVYRASCKQRPCGEARCHKFRPQTRTVADPACDKSGKDTQE